MSKNEYLIFGKNRGIIMKIIVFGATGGVGKSVVQQSLHAGLEVTAFVRTPSKLEIKHENLKAIQGDAFSSAEVSAAIAGHDAVISCLGSNTGMKKSEEIQSMTKNIVEGMKENNVDRIVYTASAGVHNELTGIMGKVIMQLLKNALNDHRAAVGHIQDAGLNYTIVRPMGLSDKEFTGKYREDVSGVPAKSSSIPRADVAHFIVKALTDSSYENSSIGLAT